MNDRQYNSKKTLILYTFIIISYFFFIVTSSMAQITGNISFEGTLFTEKPVFTDQVNGGVSLAATLELYQKWGNEVSLTLTPFGRYDTNFDKRSHTDIREMSFLYSVNNYELLIGIGKVFWGVTEFIHLVDIINQTDFMESIDGKKKLGQPMVHLSVPSDYGVIELFYMPYFRERQFGGLKERFRPGLLIKTDDAVFDSTDKEKHHDYAIRYSKSIDNWDIGISHFSGTKREPRLDLAPDASYLIPFYEIIDQYGIDLQFSHGNWLWKLEAIHVNGDDQKFEASDFGFEYTISRVLEGNANLGIISEYLWNSQGRNSSFIFANDIAFGLRLSLNNGGDSNLLCGIILDLDNQSRQISVEGSHRLGDSFKASLEARAFIISNNDVLYSTNNDDYVRLTIAYYF